MKGLVVIILVLATPALALEPAACEFIRLEGNIVGAAPPPPPREGEEEIWVRAVEMAPVDLGGGWVLSKFEDTYDFGTQFGARVADCASGTRVTITEATQSPLGSIERQTRLSAEDAFRTLIASDQVLSLDSVLGQLSAAGAETGPVYVDDMEACGCAAFYPELRGTKTAWSPQ